MVREEGHLDLACSIVSRLWPSATFSPQMLSATHFPEAGSASFRHSPDSWASNRKLGPAVRFFTLVLINFTL
jgi:hypothetical protein